MLAYYTLYLPASESGTALGYLTTAFLSSIALYFSTERPQPLSMTTIDVVFAFFLCVKWEDNRHVYPSKTDGCDSDYSVNDTRFKQTRPSKITTILVPTLPSFMLITSVPFHSGIRAYVHSRLHDDQKLHDVDKCFHHLYGVALCTCFAQLGRLCLF